MPRKRMRTVALAVSVLVCLIVLAAAVYARYIKGSNPLEETFTPSPYGSPSVEEELLTDTDGFRYKTNVAVRADDTGYAVYARLALVLTWRDGSGRVYGEQPHPGYDYQLEYNTADWRYNSADGYYYCTSPVGSGSLSPAFIGDGQKLKQLRAGPAGYTLHAEIAAQTIQAVGTTDAGTPPLPAYYHAWGFDFSN